MRPSLLCCALAAAVACGGAGEPSAPQKPSTPSGPGAPSAPTPVTYDVEARGIPHFVSANYIDLAPIVRISTFRSGVGHDYHDAFESCRSMKHYFQPGSNVDWSTVTISAPVAGKIEYLRVEQSFGTQVGIRSSEQPAFLFVLFHVRVAAGIDSGSTVTAGQRLGTHIGQMTTSDVAVGVNVPSGYKLVSWFDVLTDDLFGAYQARGVPSRAAMVVTKAQRDAEPLACNGEAFTRASTLSDWISLM